MKKSVDTRAVVPPEQWTIKRQVIGKPHFSITSWSVCLFGTGEGILTVCRSGELHSLKHLASADQEWHVSTFYVLISGFQCYVLAPLRTCQLLLCPICRRVPFARQVCRSDSIDDEAIHVLALVILVCWLLVIGHRTRAT